MNWDSGAKNGISHFSFVALRQECISVDMNKGGTAYLTSFFKGVFLLRKEG